MRARIERLSRRKFVRDAIFLQAGRIGITALSLVTAWVIIRVMGPERYGVWKLVVALLAIWETLDVTGIGTNTANLLAVAVGQRDGRNILDQMAFYVKITLSWALLTAVVLFLFAPAVAAQLYDGDRHIGELAAWFSLTIGMDALYTLVVLALSSRRLMREYAILQNVNQVILFLAVVGAVLIHPAAESLVVARLVYSGVTLALALVVYARLRGAGGVHFPPFAAVLRRALSVPIGPQWRSGVAMALDKNIATLFIQIPVSLVGSFAGVQAAGYLGIGLDIINRSNLVTGPILENMQAVIPNFVGRGDFAGLRRNFMRVLGVIAGAGIVFYGLLALCLPFLTPLIFGSETIPAVPIAQILTIFGAITAVGGIFGPLYRALKLMRKILVVKIVCGLVMLPLAFLLAQSLGAAGGAWAIVAVLGLSVGLTMAVSFPALRAAASRSGQEGAYANA